MNLEKIEERLNAVERRHCPDCDLWGLCEPHKHKLDRVVA